jgi:hypothetical protein
MGGNRKSGCKSVLALSSDEARTFFLKHESYCNFDLPPYFDFSPLLEKINEHLNGKNLSDLLSSAKKPADLDDVNHVILNNKDGHFAWRPLQLIHPVLYVSLVHKITGSSHWTLIRERFKAFAKSKHIRCVSMPVVSESRQSDKAEQVLQWWREIEQRSIELSIEYDYQAQTDVADCYGSIYTHSIAWALHGENEMKKRENRNKSTFLGNDIDKHLQDMHYGQTNGIPQGSVLCDFIAEMVLGYADTRISDEISKKGIRNYRILRYRDDYRIFTGSPLDADGILKIISEVMHEFGMKLNMSKTGVSRDVIRSSIKSDKIEWLGRRQRDRSTQKQLLLIYDYAAQHPNSGSIVRALSEFHDRLTRNDKPVHSNTAVALVAIIVDMAINNPKTYALASALISIMISKIRNGRKKKSILKKVLSKFARVPNTGYLELWLQRIAIPHKCQLQYNEALCGMVSLNVKTGKFTTNGTMSVWNNEWIGDGALKKLAGALWKIIVRDAVNNLPPVIDPSEVRLFEEYQK